MKWSATITVFIFLSDMWLSYRRECICNRCQQAADPTVCRLSSASRGLLRLALMSLQPSPSRRLKLTETPWEKKKKNRLTNSHLLWLPDAWGVCLVKLHNVYKRILRSNSTMLPDVWGLEKCHLHCTNLVELLQNANSCCGPLLGIMHRIVSFWLVAKLISALVRKS